ncbi:type III secretion protein [Pseudomonas yamanorum]|uniref:type III secretion protein n=1 Tax=Pseudomonas yamanorum TaxID=515393 RepID=UPI00210A2D5D|nr:type III secretion protein [Pseudomonas yamanorum]
MSVLGPNQSVTHSPTNSEMHQAGTAALALARSLVGPESVTVNFGAPENKTGPMFAGPQAQSTADPRGFAPGSFPTSNPGGFLDNLITQFQTFLNNLKSLFSPARPNPGCCPAAPAKPEPGYGRPDPQYSRRSNDQLGELLKDNFNAFRAPGTSHVTQQSLQDMADRRLTGNEDRDQNILLARELLRRPEVLQAFDRSGGTGNLDGRITRKDLDAVLSSDNPLKYQSDKQIAEQMLKDFNALKGGFWKSSININDLHRMAALPLTGNPRQDSLIQLAREVTQRSSLLTQMDNFASQDNDGKIVKDALRWLSR